MAKGDANGRLEAIQEQHARVQHAKRAWKTGAEKAKNLKGKYEAEQAALEGLIEGKESEPPLPMERS